MRKTAVFGIFERDGKVYTQIVSNCSKATLQGIIRGKVDPDTVINSDGWPGYDGLGPNLGLGMCVSIILVKDLSEMASI